MCLNKDDFRDMGKKGVLTKQQQHFNIHTKKSNRSAKKKTSDESNKIGHNNIRNE